MRSEEEIKENIIFNEKLLDLNKYNPESIGYINTCGFVQALKWVLDSTK